jgi:hypothetical protein
MSCRCPITQPTTLKEMIYNNSVLCGTNISFCFEKYKFYLHYQYSLIFIVVGCKTVKWSFDYKYKKMRVPLVPLCVF